MNGIDRAKELIKERNFEGLDDIWTDLITQPEIRLEEFFNITDTLKDNGESSRAVLLLELLSEHYETQQKYKRAIEIQRHILRYQPEDPKTCLKIIQLLKTAHADSTHLDEYLEFSGLTKGDPILKAIARFEEFLKYDIGNYFYFERYGMGEVVDVRPSRREIIIDFEKKKKHFLTISVANGLLLPINESHFLYKKYKQIDELKSLATSKPLDLAVMLLESVRTPLTASQIKGYLQGIVIDKELSKFWEKVRKLLERHDNVKVDGKTAKAYTYVASAADKESLAIKAFQKASIREKYRLAEEYAKKLKPVFGSLAPQIEHMASQALKSHPGIALDIFMLYQDLGKSDRLQYSIDDILTLNRPEQIITDMVNHEHQAKFLSILKERYPVDWSKRISNIMFESADFRVLDAAAELLATEPVTLTDIYQKIFIMPKQYPKQFQWMLKKIDGGVLREYQQPALIPRFIDCLDFVRGIKSTIMKILSLDKFDQMVGQATEKEVLRIRESIERSATFTEHEKKNFLRIIEHHFPLLFEKKVDVIYSTATALRQKKKELDHILNVEILENKQDISRAREFGDLSENFEYKAAKERQDQLYQKVKTIEWELQKTELIDASKITTDRVDVGTTVTLEKTADRSRIVYTILGRWDTDLEKNIISNEAPLARVIIGKKCGDVVDIEEIEHKIVEIDKAL
jgi:transcription elongation factor GreA-like protein/transcription elongation GreA/GreB family factor